MAAGVVDQILLGQQEGQQKLVGLVDQAVVVLMTAALAVQVIRLLQRHLKAIAAVQALIMRPFTVVEVVAVLLIQVQMGQVIVVVMVGMELQVLFQEQAPHLFTLVVVAVAYITLLALLEQAVRAAGVTAG